MKVKDLMTQSVCTVTPGTNINEVARLMVKHDIGAIPVAIKDEPVGIITDRDIVCRSLAKGEDPYGHTAGDYMSSSVIGINENAHIRECLQRMEEYQIRRMLVLDQEGKICGIISQADVARECSVQDKAELLEKVSV